MGRIDISMPLFAGMPAFPGDPPFSAQRIAAVSQGDAFDLTFLSFGSHTGTHVDPPVHMLPAGLAVDRIDLDLLNGPSCVVEVAAHEQEIGVEAVARVPQGSARVLFRSPNSERWAKSLTFFPDYVGLTPAAADALVERNVRLVGIDALSIENDPGATYPVHRTLLGHGIPLLEGLLLASVRPGSYELECLPLKIRDGDGGPARAALVSP